MAAGFIWPFLMDVGQISFLSLSLLSGVQTLLMFGVPALLIFKAAGKSREDIKQVMFKPDSTKAGLSMLAAVSYVLSAVLVTSLTYLLFDSLGIRLPLPDPLLPNTLTELLVLLVTSALIPAICEEAFFRLALPLLFEKKLSHRVSVLLSAVLFSALHLNLMAVPMLLILSLFLHKLFDRHKNLSLLIIFHGMYNFSVLVLNYKKAQPGFSAALLSIAIFVLTTRFLLREET